MPDITYSIYSVVMDYQQFITVSRVDPLSNKGLRKKKQYRNMGDDL